MRSKFFAEYAAEIFLKNRELRTIYANVVKKFIYSISIIKIYRYDIFEQKAYDATLFFNLFGADSDQIYDYLYNKYGNPYLLQQRALLLSKIGRHAESFHYIDMAYNKLPNNFGVKNSLAIITFEANNGKHTDFAILQLRESMKILDQCYRDDKRKIYHAQKYAEFALILYNNYKISNYIEKAKKKLDAIKSPNLKQIGRLKRKLKAL